MALRTSGSAVAGPTPAAANRRHRRCLPPPPEGDRSAALFLAVLLRAGVPLGALAHLVGKRAHQAPQQRVEPVLLVFGEGRRDERLAVQPGEPACTLEDELQLAEVRQRGTLTETLDAWKAAQQAGFAGIVSARSGETEDVTIVHLAVGWGVGQLKVGSFARSERMAKWNEALRIEERLGTRARFAGAAAFGSSKRTGP